MLRLITILTLIVVLAGCEKNDIADQGQSAFIKKIGGANTNEPVDIVNYDKGYMVLSNVINEDETTKATLIFSDFNGNPTKEIILTPIEVNEEARFLYNVSDGVLAAGVVADSVGSNIVISKVDFNGTVVWRKEFDKSRQDNVVDITMLNDTLYVLGTTYGVQNIYGEIRESVDGWLIALSMNGDVISDTTYDNMLADDYCTSLYRIDDSWLITGSNYNTGFQIPRKAFLTFVYDRYEIPLQVSPNENVNVVKTLLQDSTLFSVGTINIDGSNKILVEKFIVFNDVSGIHGARYLASSFILDVPGSLNAQIEDVILGEKQNLIFAGTAQRGTHSDMFLMIADLDGDILDTQFYGDNTNQEGSAITINQNKDIMLVGNTDNNVNSKRIVLINTGIKSSF